jgi:hypothetical protein
MPVQTLERFLGFDESVRDVVAIIRGGLPCGGTLTLSACSAAMVPPSLDCCGASIGSQRLFLPSPALRPLKLNLKIVRHRDGVYLSES